MIARVILGAALALPRYLSYEIFHSITKHRFLCNLISSSNAYIPGNTSTQLVAGTARPLGYYPEGSVTNNRKNHFPAAPSSPATPLLIYNDSDNEVSFFYTSLRIS